MFCDTGQMGKRAMDRRANWQMGKWADGQMGRWANEQMGKWTDEQMGRWAVLSNHNQNLFLVNSLNID
jgi:hypothetical protein